MLINIYSGVSFGLKKYFIYIIISICHQLICSVLKQIFNGPVFINFKSTKNNYYYYYSNDFQYPYRSIILYKTIIFKRNTFFLNSESSVQRTNEGKFFFSFVEDTPPRLATIFTNCQFKNCRHNHFTNVHQTPGLFNYASIIDVHELFHTGYF